MSAGPLVSVLMGVHDSARHLDAAVESILGQTWTHLELVLVDDGSTDGSAEMVERWGHADRRVLARRHPHRGIVATLNRAIDLAGGDYLAIADHDDVSLPQRIERQVAFMESRPEVGLSSGGGWTLPEGLRWHQPSDPDEIRSSLLFGVSVAHPAMIIRRSWLDEAGLRYDPDYPYAQDYDLLERASRQTVLANLSDPLIRYRIHPGQTSRVARSAQLEAAARVRRRQIERLGIDASERDFALHEALSRFEISDDPAFLRRAQAWLERLAAANAVVAEYPEPAFSRQLAVLLYRVYAASPSLALRDVSAFRAAALDEGVTGSTRLSTSLLARSLVPRRLVRAAGRSRRKVRSTVSRMFRR